MTYYHVRVSVQGSQHDEVKTDLDEESLERQFLEPYRNGRAITVNGKSIPMLNIERIRISSSEVPSADIIASIKADDRNSRVVRVGGVSLAWRAAARSSDVTDQYIVGPPGLAEADAGGAIALQGTVSGDPNSVFVVAGRDVVAVRAVTALLRAVGLRVVEWSHAVARTGLPNPYVGDVVEAGLRMAGAAVVLLTPDDQVRLRPDLLSESDSADERETRGQARPNVYYEAGIADAIGRERTILVEIGSVKSFTDAAGRHVVRYDGSAAKRHALVERLRLAGLSLDIVGEEWLTVGDIGPAIAAARSAVDGETVQSRAGLAVTTDTLRAVDELLALHESLKRQATYSDLSDIPDELMEFAIRAQALLDGVASGSSYAAEAQRVRSEEAFIRVPVLVAVLRALKADTEDPAGA